MWTRWRTHQKKTKLTPFVSYLPATTRSSPPHGPKPDEMTSFSAHQAVSSPRKAPLATLLPSTAMLQTDGRLHLTAQHQRNRFSQECDTPGDGTDSKGYSTHLLHAYLVSHNRQEVGPFSWCADRHGKPYTFECVWISSIWYMHLCERRSSHLVRNLGAVLVECLVRHSAAQAHGGDSPGLGAGNPAVARLQQILRHLQMGFT